VPEQIEVLVREQMLNISTCAGKEIVHANNDGSLAQQPLAQMRAQKSGTPGNENPLLKVHVFSFADLS